LPERDQPAAPTPSVRPTLTPYGERGLLVELATTDQVAGWTAALRAAALPEVVDVVPAARSVLLHLSGRLTPADAARRVAALSPLPPEEAVAADELVVPVTYDGPDLAEVARLTGLSVEQVVRAHVGSAWRVGFVGFAPGFGYLVGGDPRLAVGRRADPRTRVPAGSVALASGYSAVYPRSSPGGWQLIGRTDLVLWDEQREPPALLLPGRRVRFEVAG
jgi:KipI family sensor histidine kinase inhibitor